MICFLGIHECVFETSFILSLDIYKAYFKGCHIREYKGEHIKNVTDDLFSLKVTIASLRLKVL